MQIIQIIQITQIIQIIQIVQIIQIIQIIQISNISALKALDDEVGIDYLSVRGVHFSRRRLLGEVQSSLSEELSELFK